MPYIKKICAALILLSAVLLNVGLSWAFEDGFGSAKKIYGEHLSVYCAPESDIAGLDRRLNIRTSDKVLARKSAKMADSPEKELSDSLDTLFLRVSDIMDMHLYSLQVNIKLCRDDAQLNSIYNNLFKASLGGRRSFYVFSFNTIYISIEGFSKEIIGHEMAHAIICHYFAVPPPVKIQEVLAMYVEHNLRRAGQ
ncbi:MAG: hypothetical protein A3I73_02050 [Omnitrophica bacterium RIFCSPLOWO2_02_FULL_45_16]|nr:MAG: hypothetical protein A3C51_03505 [Omnitrophica bacterium RIFCSPHIGHO2_02_FULL_46_20]OGW94375.1 MAG: hypothetical protein A3G36_06305 [Omnitrophica bacterium RIFCSPLOWO2_12_FULL_45_13]OGW94384.1 MAG: hypothetical protein A3K16_05860 [Omnitrophica bacterium RIFCSPLOWO2_01_FULL_45_24]OGX01003.1 MAG: hypothetical protein A3I73_02050 [Omnitrophica bacterium RIFCSPLOWO2_02_FULL_45_16]